MFVIIQEGRLVAQSGWWWKCDKGRDSGCALEIHLMGEPELLDVGCEGKRGVGLIPECLAKGLGR